MALSLDLDLSLLMETAVKFAAQSLDVEYSKILELFPGGDRLLLKAGVGWKPGLVGHAAVGSDLDSQAGYTLKSSHPVVVEDLRTETRFSGPALLKDHQVVSGLSVIIKTKDRPYGVFGAHTRRLRQFTEDDINFLRALANVISMALGRKEMENDLRVKAEELERNNKELKEEIAARERAEKSLKESEEKYRFMADNQPALIWASGKDTLCNYFNKVWLDFTGRTLEQELGNGWAEGVHPDDLGHCLRTYTEAFDNRRPFKMAYRLRKADGSYSWVYDHGTPQYSLDGEFLGYLGTCMDISERKVFEEKLTLYSKELARSNKELQDFAYVASHDLQEPLRKILTFGDRLSSSSNLDGQNRDYLIRMQNAAERMRNLLDSLLEYSKVTMKDAAFQQIDLAKIVSEAVEDLEDRIRDSNGTIEIGPLPSLKAEPCQMRQLFQNLISNGLKFRRDGVNPVIQIESRRKNDGEWEITVRDNGIGFEEKYAPRLFRLFERLHGHGHYGGAGMGLAICQKIVDRHNGAISVKSSPHQGATFFITLPE